MSSRPSEPIVHAWILLMRAQQVALRRIERAFRDAQMPPLIVYDALWELDKAGDAGLRPFELETRMLVNQSNISRLIERLVRDGLAQRHACEEDGRGQYVTISRGGRDLRRRMWGVYAPAIAGAVGAHLTDAQAGVLAGLLEPLTLEAD